MSAVDDDTLDRRVIASTGDEQREAFAEIWRRMRLLLLARAHRLTGDWHRAEEVVAQASAKTWRAIVAGRGPTESVTGYLLLAVQNEAARANSRGRLTPSIEDAQLANLADENEESAAEAREEHDLLDRAFQSLPAEWQRILGLTIVEEQTIAAAAAALGISSSAATSLAHRAREGLRVAYLQQYVEHAAPACREYAGQLSRYVRGSLGRAARVRLEKHLDTCPACARQVARIARVNTSLRAWIGPVAVGAGAGAATPWAWGGGAVEALVLLFTRPALIGGIVVATLAVLIGLLGGALTGQPQDEAQPEPIAPSNQPQVIGPSVTANPDAQPTPTPVRSAPTPQRTPSVPGPGRTVPVSPTPTPTRSPEDDTTEYWILIEE